MTMNIKVKEEFYVDRFPHFLIDLNGMTIVDVHELECGMFESIAVQFKETIDGAEDWDNCVEFHAESNSKDDCTFIELQRIKRIIKEG